MHDFTDLFRMEECEETFLRNKNKEKEWKQRKERAFL